MSLNIIIVKQLSIYARIILIFLFYYYVEITNTLMSDNWWYLYLYHIGIARRLWRTCCKLMMKWARRNEKWTRNDRINTDGQKRGERERERERERITIASIVVPMSINMVVAHEEIQLFSVSLSARHTSDSF